MILTPLLYYRRDWKRRVASSRRESIGGLALSMRGWGNFDQKNVTRKVKNLIFSYWHVLRQAGIISFRPLTSPIKSPLFRSASAYIDWSAEEVVSKLFDFLFLDLRPQLSKLLYQKEISLHLGKKNVLSETHRISRKSLRYSTNKYAFKERWFHIGFTQS